MYENFRQIKEIMTKDTNNDKKPDKNKIFTDF